MRENPRVNARLQIAREHADTRVRQSPQTPSRLLESAHTILAPEEEFKSIIEDGIRPAAGTRIDHVQ
jgi:hypothetical protein